MIMKCFPRFFNFQDVRQLLTEAAGVVVQKNDCTNVLIGARFITNSKDEMEVVRTKDRRQNRTTSATRKHVDCQWIKKDYQKTASRNSLQVKGVKHATVIARKARKKIAS